MVGRNRYGHPRYVCCKVPRSAHCGTVTIYAERDDEICDQIVTALSSAPFAAALFTAATGGDPGAADVTARLRAVEERRDDLAAEWAAGTSPRRNSPPPSRTGRRHDETDEVASAQRARALAEFVARLRRPAHSSPQRLSEALSR